MELLMIWCLPLKRLICHLFVCNYLCAIICVQLILSCFTDSRSQYIETWKQNKIVSAHFFHFFFNKIELNLNFSNSILSILTFWWANEIILLGYKRQKMFVNSMRYWILIPELKLNSTTKTEFTLKT